MSSARLTRSADPHPKILDLHRKKLAVIYVRQSSLYQVENHLESQKRQYQMTDRAKALGWTAPRCIVIDEDLGISGAQSFNRAFLPEARFDGSLARSGNRARSGDLPSG